MLALCCGSQSREQPGEVEKVPSEEMAFDQGFKGWIGVASISSCVNSWTGILDAPNFHDFNALDPTWSIMRATGIGPSHFDFCRRPYLHKSRLLNAQQKRLFTVQLVCYPAK